MLSGNIHALFMHIHCYFVHHEQKKSAHYSHKLLWHWVNSSKTRQFFSIKKFSVLKKDIVYIAYILKNWIKYEYKTDINTLQNIHRKCLYF